MTITSGGWGGVEKEQIQQRRRHTHGQKKRRPNNKMLWEKENGLKMFNSEYQKYENYDNLKNVKTTKY